MKSELERRVRERLLEKRMTISQLAEKLSVSRVAIYHFFKGNYSREMLHNISRILNIPVHVLLTPVEQTEGNHSTKLLSSYLASPENVRKGIDSLLNIQVKNVKTSKKFLKFASFKIPEVLRESFSSINGKKVQHLEIEKLTEDYLDEFFELNLVDIVLVGSHMKKSELRKLKLFLETRRKNLGDEVIVFDVQSKSENDVELIIRGNKLSSVIDLTMS